MAVAVNEYVISFTREERASVLVGNKLSVFPTKDGQRTTKEARVSVCPIATKHR